MIMLALLNSSPLSRDDIHAVLEAIEEKSEILAKGAAKHAPENESVFREIAQRARKANSDEIRIQVKFSGK